MRTGRITARKRIVGRAIVVALVLAPAAGTAGAAQAPKPPTIKLSPSEAPPTTTVAVHGSHFRASGTVTVWFEHKQVGTATTDGSGRFDLSFDVPASAKPGGHPVKAKSPHETAKATFLVRTDWPMFRFDTTHTGVNPYESVLSPKNVGRLQLLWSHELPFVSQGNPAVVGGVVYVGDSDGLFALDAATGEELWSYTTPHAVRSPAVADGTVYITQNNGVDAVRASDGHPLWHYSNSASSSPTVSGGVVYFGSVTGGIYALDAATGTKLWSASTGPSDATPAVTEDMVFGGDQNGHVYGIDRATGAEVWDFPTGDSVESSPAVVDGVVYVGSEDGSVYALDAATGSKIWSFPAGQSVDSSPAVHNGIVYVGAWKNIFAIKAETGKLVWNVPMPINIVSAPALANGVLYVVGIAEGKGALLALKAASGKLLWSGAIGDTANSPSVSDGVVYVGSKDYHVYAFGL